MLLPMLFLLFQQVADVSFQPPIGKPAWEEGKGPVLALDEAHRNFHTLSGRYQTFANLARRDGFVVRANGRKFSAPSLSAIRILVIANALHASNEDNWQPPNASAFTEDEVKAVQEWVRDGGSLFLIADHQPFPAAASALAAAFGIEVHNGYAFDGNPPSGMLRFAALKAPFDGVEPILTFGGSALRLPEGGVTVLPLGEGAVSRTVSNPGRPGLGETVESKPVGGWSQGGLLKYGNGRIAMFGEAAMFSAQLAGPRKAPMGMNHPDATGNPRLLLGILHWLAGVD